MHESYAFEYMHDRYWHNNAASPTAIQFPRVPPAPFGKPITMPGRPMPKMMPNPIVDNTARLDDTMDGLRHAFYLRASNLVSTGISPVPPGHPLYDRQISIMALESERDSLLKENSELKKRLEADGADEQEPSL